MGWQLLRLTVMMLVTLRLTVYIFPLESSEISKQLTFFTAND